MNRITDYKQVSPLVMKYFRRGVVTNNFLGADDFRAEIAEENLFFDAEDGALKLYVKRNGFYVLYFYVFPDCSLGGLPGANLVCEVSQKCEEILQNSGFSKFAERVKLERIGKEENGGLTETAAAADAEEIFLLMQKSFDECSAYLPTLTQLRTECENGFVKIVRGGDGISGALRWGIGGKTALIKHLCVKSTERGKGTAKRLCAAVLAEHERCAVHTGKDNKPALSLYKSMGFCEAESESAIYMKGLKK